jgi:GT2 family glycosyltransferase
MDLTICIPVFNEVDLTLDCLASVPAAAGDLCVQVIMIDNGSSDGTSQKVGQNFPEVEIIRNETNRGFACAVNRGLERALASKILILNNDTRLLPDSLQPLTTYMGENSSLGILGPRLVGEDGKLQNSIAAFPTLTEIFIGKWILRILFPRRYSGKGTKIYVPTEVESVVGAAILVRREMLDQIGLFDERFFFFFEETDLCRRAKQSGWKVCFFPGIEVVHKGGGSVRKYDSLKSIEYIRSLFLYFHKSERKKYLFLQITYPIKILLEILFYGFSLIFSLGFSPRVNRRFRKKWASFWWISRGAPEGVGLQAIK